MKSKEEMTAVELLDMLAGDVDCSLWTAIMPGSEGFWGVSQEDPGSLGATLSRIACRAEGEQMDLRGFAKDVERLLWDEGGHDLGQIYDRLEEELSELDGMRCTDERDDEDYEACRWVRDHGGLDAVRGRLGERKRLVDRCRAYEDALDMMADSLGIDKSSDKIVQARRVRKAVKNLDARLVPDGMEWPMFDDGEPVRIGDEVTVTVHDEGGDFDRTFAIRSIKYEKDGVLLDGTKNEMVILSHGERVKRPAPKVLDADGVEIRVGDKVWMDTGDGPWTVTSITTDHAWHVYGESDELGSLDMPPSTLTHRDPVIASDGKPLREGETVYKVGGDGTAYVFDGMSDNVPWLAMLHHKAKPHVGTGLRVDQLTHRAPVIAADGKPIKVGETVYGIDGKGPLTVREIERSDDPDQPEHSVWCGESCNGFKVWRIADQLTHERPDSWGRLEEDAEKGVCKYFEQEHGCGQCGHYPSECQADKARDLVRRCRALAERGA